VAPVWRRFKRKILNPGEDAMLRTNKDLETLLTARTNLSVSSYISTAVLWLKSLFKEKIIP
jgi:hypothetical protein